MGPLPPQERVKELLARPSAGGSVTVRGWLKTARHGKGISFLEVSDGSCFAGIQAIAEPALANYESAVKHLQAGCAVAIEGELVDSPGKEQRFEIRASRVDVVGPVGDDYPLQKKRHSFEFLRTIAHLRPRTNTFGAVLRVRNAASRAIHDFLQGRGFVFLHSPIITSSDCEGAGEMFRVSTLDAAQPPRGPEGRVDFAQDFFGREAHLTVSGQLTNFNALTNTLTGGTFQVLAGAGSATMRLANANIVTNAAAIQKAAGDCRGPRSSSSRCSSSRPRTHR